MKPRRGRQRDNVFAMMDDLRADFRAGKDTRFTSRLAGVDPTGSGADYHYRSDQQFLHLIERARHYQRNDRIVGQAVRRLVANVVQDGFTLDPQTGDKGADLALKDHWNDWASDPDQCDVEGELTFNAFEQLSFSSTIVDGDVILLPLQAGSLQAVEAHRLRTPSNTKQNVVHGVKLSDDGKRVEYWITKQDLGLNRPLTKVGDVRPYPARDDQGYRAVLHLFQPQRFSQRRGVSALAPISDDVGMLDDVQFATLVKAQHAALVTILRQRSEGWTPVVNPQLGLQRSEDLGGFTRTIEELNAGLEIASDPGEIVSFDSAKVPSPEFFLHSQLILTFIAINLDLPVAVLLLDPSETNFSGWRGAIDQARMRFRQIQQWLIARLHCPVYRWKVRQWAATDPALRAALARDARATLKHRWNPPRFPYIEPLTDAQADLLAQQNLLDSPRRIQAKKGQDWDDIIEEVAQDFGIAIRRGLAEAQAINSEYPGAGITWRDCVPMSLPQGVQIGAGPDQQQRANQQAEPAGPRRSIEPSKNRFASNGAGHN